MFEELIAIIAMLGAFGLLLLIVWLLKRKPIAYPPLAEVSPALTQESVPQLLDYRRITLPYLNNPE